MFVANLVSAEVVNTGGRDTLPPKFTTICYVCSHQKPTSVNASKEKIVVAEIIEHQLNNVTIVKIDTALNTLWKYDFSPEYGFGDFGNDMRLYTQK